LFGVLAFGDFLFQSQVSRADRCRYAQSTRCSERGVQLPDFLFGLCAQG